MIRSNDNVLLSAFRQMHGEKRGADLALAAAAWLSSLRDMSIAMDVPNHRTEDARDVLTRISKLGTVRERLIWTAEHGVVPVSQWRNRDTPGAQEQLSVALGLLRAGAPWRLSDSLRSTSQTIWIEIGRRTFSSIENGTDHLTWDLFYFPTEDRLLQAAGGDWY